MDTSAQSVKEVLFVVAASGEAQAAVRGLSLAGNVEVPEWEAVGVGAGVSLLRTGVGKANAAGAVACVCNANKYRAIVNVGIAGALPESELEIGSVIGGSASVFADEGLETEDGFRTIAEMGFPLGPRPIEGVRIPGDSGLVARLRGHVDAMGAIATVSTCSGTDALARRVRERTGADAECMEGAAIAQVCARLGVPFVEVRVISNTTGDRGSQRWDIKRAFERMSAVLGRVAAELARG
jgi:futalosine hydrolase